MKDIIFDPPTKFFFKSGDYVPFKDREVCERVRLLTREELEKHEADDVPTIKVENPNKPE